MQRNNLRRTRNFISFLTNGRLINFKLFNVMILFYPQGQEEPICVGKNRMTTESMSETYEPDTVSPEEFKAFEERAYQIDGCS